MLDMARRSPMVLLRMSALSAHCVEEDEGGPVGTLVAQVAGAVGVVGVVVFHILPGLVEGLALGLAGDEGGVELGHQVFGGLVAHLPQAHHDGLCPCFLETALQAEHAIALDFAKPRLAGREHQQVEAPQVELGDFLRGEHTVINTGGDFNFIEGVVGSGEEQSAARHRLVLDISRAVITCLKETQLFHRFLALGC